MKQTWHSWVLALGGLALLAGGVALAQESASHSLEEHTFNAGGHPSAGVNPASASHQITLGSLGDPFSIRRLFGASSTLDVGFVISYPPPGEVLNVLFTGQTTLVWDPDPGSDIYNVYRALIATLPGLGFGACWQQDVATTTTADTTLPPVGEGFFYLVTVENRLDEEGTKGFTSAGTERAGSLCP